MQQKSISILSKTISKLPGLGPRIAKKIVLNLALNKEKTLIPLIQQLQDIYHKVQHCNICGNLDESPICNICNNHNRDQQTVCVVEEVADLWAIERINVYQGCFHVLGGNLCALSGKTPTSLNMNNLFNRLQQQQFKEIIIATSATINGQNTANFIVDQIQQMHLNCKITRLAYGIPVGSELDYLDDGTLSIALLSRKDFD
jgi:recombination protein RecR